MYDGPPPKIHVIIQTNKLDSVFKTCNNGVIITFLTGCHILPKLLSVSVYV